MTNEDFEFEVDMRTVERHLATRQPRDYREPPTPWTFREEDSRLSRLRHLPSRLRRHHD